MIVVYKDNVISEYFVVCVFYKFVVFLDFEVIC